MYILIDYEGLWDHYRQGICKKLSYQEICPLGRIQLNSIWSTQRTAAILQFASRALLLLGL